MCQWQSFQPVSWFDRTPLTLFGHLPITGTYHPCMHHHPCTSRTSGRPAQMPVVCMIESKRNTSSFRACTCSIDRMQRRPYICRSVHVRACRSCIHGYSSHGQVFDRSYMHACLYVRLFLECAQLCMRYTCIHDYLSMAATFSSATCNASKLGIGIRSRRHLFSFACMQPVSAFTTNPLIPIHNGACMIIVPMHCAQNIDTAHSGT